MVRQAVREEVGAIEEGFVIQSHALQLFSHVAEGVDQARQKIDWPPL